MRNGMTHARVARGCANPFAHLSIPRHFTRVRRDGK